MIKFKDLKIGDKFYPRYSGFEFYWIIISFRDLDYFIAEAINFDNITRAGSGEFSLSEFNDDSWIYKPNKEPEFQKQLKEIVFEENEDQ